MHLSAEDAGSRFRIVNSETVGSHPFFGYRKLVDRLPLFKPDIVLLLSTTATRWKSSYLTARSAFFRTAHLRTWTLPTQCLQQKRGFMDRVIRDTPLDVLYGVLAQRHRRLVETSEV